MLEENILQAIEDGPEQLEAGFFIYHDTSQNKYYGYFIDEGAKIGMLTKAYSTERNCENALQRFRTGKFVSDTKKGKKGYFAEFRSESGKLIAWSPEFATQEEAVNTIRQPEQKVKPQKKAKPATSAKEAATPQPPRHSFRLDFYQGGEDNPIRGRIEYSLTQDNAAFQGLDMGFVRSFVSRHLNKGGGQEEAAEFGTGTISIFEDGQPAKQSIFSTENRLEARVEY